MHRFISIGMVLILMGTVITQAQQKNEVKEWFKDQYSYINPNLEIPADSLQKLERNWKNATRSSLSQAKRKEALRSLIETMVHLQDAEQRYNAPSISNLVRRFWEIEGLSSPPSRKIEGASAELNYNHIEPVGQGETDIILISDIFADASIYDPFIDNNKHRYTFHPVNLPGFGDTPPLPLPERRSFKNAPWFTQVEEAIVEYVEQNSLENPVVMGIWGSGYVAAQLAVNHSDLFSHTVLLNTPMNALLFIDPGNPTGLSPVQVRLNYLNNRIPNLFPAADVNQRRENARGMAGFYTSNQNRIPILVESLTATNPKIRQQYVAELVAQDYEKDLSRLQIPLLSITALHPSDGQRGGMGSQFINAEWEQAESKYSSEPLNHIIFEDTRTYIPLDALQEMELAVNKFLEEGNIVDKKDASPENRGYQISPRKNHRGMIGATAIEIDYGSPSMRGREIYGNVVPYGTAWRAGANNITKIRFYNDVEVAGKSISKGTYGIFVIPKKDEPWEIAFMDYTLGTGGRGFAYDSAYTHLSLQVEPDSAAVENKLRYFVHQQTPVDGVLGFTWAGRNIELPVRASEGINKAKRVSLNSVKSKNWNLLHTEEKADGNYDSRADAQKVSYNYNSSSDSLWFKIELENEMSSSNIGINLIVDQDQDQTTGNFWYGHNNSFAYDRLGTVFVVKSKSGNYVGTVGMSNDEFIANNRQFTHDIKNNFSLAVDGEEQIWYVGVPLSDVDPDGRFNLSVAVGGSRLWNDDIPNSGFIKVNVD